jgi:hypothetical protein
MGIANLFVPKKLKIANGLFEYIELDASMSETYSHDATVTEHPVEEGANITDHVRVQQFRLAIDGFVTNHAISRALVNLDFTRAEDIYTILRDWQKQAARLTVTTGLDEFEDLVLKSFTVTRDKETGNALPVQLQLVEIQTAESQTSTAKAPAIKAAKKKKVAAKKVKKEEKRISLLQQAKNAVSKFVGGS